MNGTRRVLVLLISMFSMTNDHAFSQDRNSSQRPAHVHTSFQFRLSASLHLAAPLFGPEGERCWAGEQWNPQFLHPQSATDIEGAVFTVQHGPHKSVWVNTRFDVSAGQMQYVSLIPDVLVSIIDVRLAAVDPATTNVEVTYVRTALSVSANDEVHALATSSHSNAAHWQEAIQSCLDRQKNRLVTQ